MARLTVVMRQDCELCEQMLAQLAALGRSRPLPPLTLVDVEEDAQAAQQYSLEIPVLLLDGEVICRHGLDLPGLLKRLDSTV